MSRGLGRVERAVLELLPAYPRCLTPSQLAAMVYGEAVPSQAQKVSVRRAVRSLRAKGLVGATRGAREVRGDATYDRIDPRRGYRCTESGCRRCEEDVPRHTRNSAFHIKMQRVTVAETPVRRKPPR